MSTRYMGVCCIYFPQVEWKNSGNKQDKNLMTENNWQNSGLKLKF